MTNVYIAVQIDKFSTGIADNIALYIWNVIYSKNKYEKAEKKGYTQNVRVLQKKVSVNWNM